MTTVDTLVKDRDFWREKYLEVAAQGAKTSIELVTAKKDSTYFYQRCHEYQLDLHKERTARQRLEQRLRTIEALLRPLVEAVCPDDSAPPDAGMTEDEVITKFWVDHRMLSGPTKAGK